jgi:hypothetical protein
VNGLAGKTDFLKTPTATFARGHLVAWAAEYQIFRLIRDGIWPYDCEWVPYAKPTGVYLRIDTGESFVTVSQLTDMREGPRVAVFRTMPRSPMPLCFRSIPSHGRLRRATEST